MDARRIVTMLVLTACAGSIAAAGEIYGKVVEGSTPAAGAVLEATCGSKAYPAVTTDKTGSYRVVLAETGKCSMSVRHKGQSASLDIASYDDAAQIDIVLVMKDGKLSARRK